MILRYTNTAVVVAQELLRAAEPCRALDALVWARWGIPLLVRILVEPSRLELLQYSCMPSPPSIPIAPTHRLLNDNNSVLVFCVIVPISRLACRV